MACLFEFWHLDCTLLCSILRPHNGQFLPAVPTTRSGSAADVAPATVLPPMESCELRPFAEGEVGHGRVSDEPIYFVDELGNLWPLDQEGKAWPEGLDFCILGHFRLDLAAFMYANQFFLLLIDTPLQLNMIHCMFLVGWT